MGNERRKTKREGTMQMRFLIGELRAPDDALIDATVNRAVDVFLHGARPRNQRRELERELAGQERG